MASLRETPIEVITEADLQRLLTEEIPENRQLEYKRDLWAESPDGHREFLKDIAAFANAQGGDLIVGIEERDHLPIALPGVSTGNAEGLLVALENRQRSRLEPPLGAFPMRWIPLASGNQALVIRVPGSLRAPHRDRQSGHFHIRGERRVDQMGIDELRDAFLGSEQLSDRLRQLHRAAVDVQTRPELPDRVTAEASAVVSVMPLDVLRARRDLNITIEESVRAYLPAGGGQSWLRTLEGVVWYTGKEDIKAFALTRRRGSVDAFWTINSQVSPTNVAYHRFEDGLISMVTAGRAHLRRYGVDGELIVMTTLLGLCGTTIGLDVTTFEGAPPLRRHTADLPEVIGAHFGREELKPVIDAFWRLYGRTRPTG